MKRTLLAMTTANQVAYTRMAIESYRRCDLNGVDLWVVDDASEDETVRYCEANGVDIQTKDAARGVTDSWNLAYRRFRERDYDFLLLANNDILIPRGAIEQLLEVLERYVIAGPMSTLKGVCHQPQQALSHHQQLGIDETDPANCQSVQDRLNRLADGPPVAELPFLNGFFLGLSRAVCKYELMDGNLFDSKFVNVGNEDDLCQRIAEAKACALRSFIFHCKGVSFSEHKADDVLVYDRELTWGQTRALREDPRAVYRYAIERGLSEPDPSVQLFGFPRWMVRRWLGKAFRCLALQLSWDRSLRRESVSDFCYFSGLMMGRRGANRPDSPDVAGGSGSSVIRTADSTSRPQEAGE